MKYFIDTEFIESGPHKPIQLISIGIVAEDGRELYMQSSEFCAKLDPHGEYHSLNVIASAIAGFVGDETPEFWGYYADYDWVVFCQIFGAMIDLPRGWPMYCRDIKQFCDSLGNPELPKQGKCEHNALADARWNKLAFDHLMDVWRGK